VSDESRRVHPCFDPRQGQDTANQLEQLREFCKAQNWPIVVEYEDHESGGKADSAQFGAMMADATRRKFDVVVFWALGRFLDIVEISDIAISASC
jgi:DNA invertase Pin-like site-specific DNA recombinase